MKFKKRLLLLLPALMLLYTGPVRSDDTRDEAPTTKIVAAAEAISKGSIIITKHVEYKDVSKDAITLDSIFNTAKVLDKVAKSDIGEGQAITKSDLVNDGSLVFIVNLKDKTLEKLKGLSEKNIFEETATKILNERLAEVVIEETPDEEKSEETPVKENESAKKDSEKKSKQ